MPNAAGQPSILPRNSLISTQGGAENDAPIHKTQMKQEDIPAWGYPKLELPIRVVLEEVVKSGK